MTKKASKHLPSKRPQEEEHKEKKTEASKKSLKVEGAFKNAEDVEQFIHAIYSIRKVDVE